MTDRAKAISKSVRKQRPEFLEYLKFLVEEETPSDKPEEFSDLMDRLQQSFEQVSLKVEQIEGNETAGHLLIKPEGFNPEAPAQLIVGHVDTVWNMGTLESMPFEVNDNIATGPGIFDMKTGICMMVFAMRVIRDLDLELPVQPIFLINSDEEIGSNESKQLLYENAKLAERTFVLEPALGTEGKIKTARKGIGLFEVSIKGRPSHAGLDPEKGVSAILGLSHIVQQLFDLNDPERGVSVNVGTIEGGERSNVIAAKSKAVVDVRVPTMEDGEKIKKKIYNLTSELEGIDVEISGEISRPPMEQKAANKTLWRITEQLGEELELDLRQGTSGGGSDGNFTNMHSPTIDGLGAVGEGAHAYHERIYIEETLQRLSLLSMLLIHPSIDYDDYD